MTANGRRWLWICGTLVALVLAFKHFGSSVSTVDLSAAQAVADGLSGDGVLTHLDCGTGRASFNRRAWDSLNGDRQRNAAMALARVCLEQHGNGQMDVLDSQSDALLGHFDGRTLTAR